MANLTTNNTYRVLRLDTGQAPQQVDDHLACEQPLEIRVGGESINVTMRTPGHDAELAAGFLLSEAIIQSADDIDGIAACDQNSEHVAEVTLGPHVKVDFAKLSRYVFASSSCGLCGKTSIESVHSHFAPVTSDITMSAATMVTLPAVMREAQSAFQKTGGIHAAAIFDTQGDLVVVREDIGRHNAVDKVLGYALLRAMLPLDKHLLLVSGRASFEIVQKALAGRLAMVAAVSAPSDLAVQFAADSNQTLVGFLRDQRMNVYCCEQRITFNGDVQNRK
jgi:FdhD protein